MRLSVLERLSIESFLANDLLGRFLRHALLGSEPRPSRGPESRFGFAGR